MSLGVVIRTRLVVFILPSLAQGGAELNTVNLANHFVQIGFRVEVWSILRDRTLESRFSPQVTIKILNKERLRESIFSLFSLIKKSRPCYIVANLWPLNLIVGICSLLSRSTSSTILVEHVNLSCGLCSNTVLEKIAALFFHWIGSKLGLRFVAVSNGVRDDLVKCFYVNRGSIHTIFNPVLPSKVDNLPSSTNPLPCEQVNMQARRLILLAVGSLKPQKNYELLIDAMAVLVLRLPRAQLLIAGEGPVRPTLESHIKSSGLSGHVTLLGRVDDPSSLYLSADVFVLSSSWEGLANVLVEALFWGCRVVSTDCPSGPREVLGDGRFGELVPSNDVQALVNAVIKVQTREFDRTEILEHLTQFRTDVVANQYMNVMGLR